MSACLCALQTAAVATLFTCAPGFMPSLRLETTWEHGRVPKLTVQLVDVKWLLHQHLCFTVLNKNQSALGAAVVRQRVSSAPTPGPLAQV